MYDWKTRIRYSELDSDAVLSIGALVNVFQDCANFDSEDHGVGLSFLMENKMAWILLGWEFDIRRLPTMGEHVVVSTLPYDFKGSFGYRNFVMSSQDGELLARADSMWMFANWETLRPLRIPEEIYGKYELEEAVFRADLRTKPQMEGLHDAETFRIMKQHLDTNQHVNNAQYVDFATQYLPKDCCVKRMCVQYRKQAFLGDEVHAHVGRDGAEFKVMLCNAEQEVYATFVFRIEDK